jgi:hypothetical protein
MPLRNRGRLLERFFSLVTLYYLVALGFAILTGSDARRGGMSQARASAEDERGRPVAERGEVADKV